MAREDGLACNETTLMPSGHWAAPADAWVLAQPRSGAAYWRQPSGDFEVGAGAVVLSGPGGGGRILASQLGPVPIRWFSARIDHLGGVMSVTERRAAEALAATRPAARVFAPGDPVHAAFEQLFGGGATPPFVRRSRMIRLVAEALGPLIPATAQAPADADDARRRVRQWLGRTPESGLLSCSIEDLARETGCSVRHFSRLFRAETGQSFRARQTELRLVRARELLRASDAKVIEVALESGYRHLGLFNALFKRRFGMTPTTWRRQALEARPRRRATPHRVAGIAALAFLALAAAPGSDAAETNAPANTNAPARTPRFAVQRYDVTGNSLLPTNVVASVLQPFTGDAIDFETVRKGLAALQLEYRTRGFATVSLNLPPQQLTNGVVRVEVLEGRLADITVTGNKWFDAANVRRALPGLRTNTFLNSRLFQAELDAANANRDRQIYPQIVPGPEPGTSAVQLKVKDQLPLHGRFELNNLALPATPDLRGNATLQYNNLWQREHSLGLQYGFSPQAFRDRAAWDPFDRPLVASYSAFYRFPVSDPQSLPDVAAANPGRFGWDEGSRRFRLPPSMARSEVNLFASRFSLDSGVQLSPLQQVNPPPVALYSQDSGRNTTLVEDVGARFTKPLPELRGWQPVFQAGLDLKHFEFASFNTNNFTTEFLATNTVTGEVTPNRQTFASPQPSRSGTVTYLPVSARVDASRPDSRGTTSLGLGVVASVAGHPFSTVADYYNAGGSRVNGTFVAVQASAARDHRIAGDWTVQFRADGQWVNHSVLSLERFGLAGSGGVRGYQEGASFGDRGWRVVAEPRTPSWNLGLVDGRSPFLVRGLAFMDYGENYTAVAGGSDAITRLWGTGVGVSGGIGSTLDFRTTVGWALHDGAGARRGDFRFYFGIGVQF